MVAHAPDSDKSSDDHDGEDLLEFLADDTLSPTKAPSA